MVHKTILKLRAQNKELIESNGRLLENNVKLAEENKSLKAAESILVTQKEECKKKCEFIIHQKDDIIRQKEERYRSLKSIKQNLDEGTWTRNVKEINGGIEISNIIMWRK
jgi:hypothetical protein